MRTNPDKSCTNIKPKHVFNVINKHSFYNTYQILKCKNDLFLKGHLCKYWASIDTRLLYETPAIVDIFDITLGVGDIIVGVCDVIVSIHYS